MTGRGNGGNDITGPTPRIFPIRVVGIGNEPNEPRATECRLGMDNGAMKAALYASHRAEKQTAARK